MHGECSMSCLSQSDDIFIEAKRVIISNELAEISALNLSDIVTIPSERCANIRQCSSNLPWNDTNFWKDIPNPKTNPDVKNQHTLVPVNVSRQTIEVLQKIDDVQKKTKNILQSMYQFEKERELLRMCFKNWRTNVSNIIEKRKQKETEVLQKEKLNRFIKNLNSFKKNADVNASINVGPKNNTSLETKKKQNIEGNSCINFCRHSHSSGSKVSLIDSKKKNSMEPTSLQNRFKAQKSIIEAQKAKLEEQNKLIEELKIGIIREDLAKTLDTAKTNIREIFNECSDKAKLKVMPHLEYVEEEREKFMLKTQKAPRMVQKMEERALERARKREIILERKRIIEEKKKRLIEEAIEKKRVQDEEERKRNLELIKEKRRRELELERIRQANKQKFLDKMKKAESFHNKKLMRKCFSVLNHHCLSCITNLVKSEMHYENKLKSYGMKSWLEIIEDKYTIKYCVADTFHNAKLLKNMFTRWRQIQAESICSMQTAQDYYDFKLQLKTFIHLHRYVCIQIVLTEKQLVKAKKHYNRRILFQYFHQWRSLPAVLQLEKAKEEKKRKWREKVWEILPDYKPPIEDF